MTLDPSAAAELRALGYDPDDPALEHLVVDGLAGNLEELARLQHLYPLACSVLWVNDRAPWDQRRAVAAVMQASTVGLVLGGWRSGKSEGLKQLTVAMALGGDHPAVQAWLEVNDLPRHCIPDGPAQVYAAAPSSNDSVRFHRDDFDRLVGPGRGTWYNRNGKGEALLSVPVPGSKTPAKIWFKSVDQGRRSFQGISIRWGWIDEEPLGDVGYGVYDELKARVADQGGHIGISMVPAEGLTWVYDRLIRDRMDDAVVCELDTLDNPHLPREAFKRLYSGMTDDEVATRRHGKFRSRSGAIYAQWAPGDGDRGGVGHVCRPFDLPPEWPRFRGADFGLDNPTCVLWGALGDDDTLYIYREHYEAGPTYEQHGETVKARSAGEAYQGSWGDPSASEVMSTTWASMDLYFDLANREVRAGIDEVKNRLRLRSDNRPRLKVFDTCTNLIREFPGYIWDSNYRGEQPVKKNDHAMDALRYLAMGIKEWRGV